MMKISEKEINLYWILVAFFSWMKVIITYLISLRVKVRETDTENKDLNE